jgi:sec-independent protein translocase protein TatB
MFDIGFLELAVIGVVALIVIGPEKLPAVARTLGFWLGKARRFVATVQDDINREVNKTGELKRLLEEQSKIKEMHEIIEQTVDETRKSVSVGAKLDLPKIDDNQHHAQADTVQENQANTGLPPSANANQKSGSKLSAPADQVNEQSK